MGGGRAGGGLRRPGVAQLSCKSLVEHKEIKTYPLFFSSLLLSLTGCQGSHAAIDASSSHLHNSLGWEQWECPSTSVHTLASLFRAAWHCCRVPSSLKERWPCCPGVCVLFNCVSAPSTWLLQEQLAWGMPALMAALSGPVFLWKRRDSGNKITPFCPFPPLSPLFVGSQEMFALWPEGHKFRAAALCAQLWLAAALGNSSASIFPISKLKLKGFCYIQATKQHLTPL